MEDLCRWSEEKKMFCVVLNHSVKGAYKFQPQGGVGGGGGHICVQHNPDQDTALYITMSFM